MCIWALGTIVGGEVRAKRFLKLSMEGNESKKKRTVSLSNILATGRQTQ